MDIFTIWHWVIRNFTAIKIHCVKMTAKIFLFLNMITKLTKNRLRIWLQKGVVGAVPRRIYDGFYQATKHVRNALSFRPPCFTVLCLWLNISLGI